MREVASKKSPSQNETWLRQGQVASARTTGPTDSLPRLAARRLTELTDLTDPEALKAVCRFDMLSALIISETETDKHLAPNTQAPLEFSEELVEPLVINELRRRESPLRQYVFPGDDDGLREIVGRPPAQRGQDEHRTGKRSPCRAWGYCGPLVEPPSRTECKRVTRAVSTCKPISALRAQAHA